jgi:predicted nuclease of restriction endonuclease-like RecB superfamily
VRFSLQDVRKSVQRRGGELFVSLHFLHPGELYTEIARLLSYYESLSGEPQRSFSFDDARASIGDYRMANCLIATLSNWYNWQPREWAPVVQAMGAATELLALASPVQLRLALYAYVNEHYHGFLSVQHRDEALQAFATQLQLSSVDLEYLLLLDSEEEAVLTRQEAQAPDPHAVAVLYNQWVFESALFNASSVRFVIDCAAFAARQADRSSAPFTTTGVGSVIKRLGYLARRLGVYYDLEYVPSTRTDESATSSPLLALTLYGPQDVTGAPQQYGLRLARLCRLLLGYGVAKTSSSQPSSRPRRRSLLPAGIVQAEARIHFSQRAYTFSMTANLPDLLPTQDAQTSDQISSNRQNNDESELFDSSIEQTFSEAFVALATSNGADGWQLEREPEPLLLEKGIFIPDFALTRGQKRIYMEILGFWTSSYRERKVQRLQQLQGRDDLLLALPTEAYEAFAAVIPHFPTVVYSDQLSATEILQVLRKQYDDFAQRLESIDVATIREQVEREGFLVEQRCYELLHCYRRSELQQAAERVVARDERKEIVFVAGMGLYHRAWLEEMKQSFLQWLIPLRTASLAEVVQALKVRHPLLKDCAGTTIETMLSLWPEVLLRRDSIFDTTVEAVLEQSGEGGPASTSTTSEPISGQQESVKEARKPARERRGAPRKQSSRAPEVVQGDLWE